MKMATNMDEKGVSKNERIQRGGGWDLNNSKAR